MRTRRTAPRRSRSTCPSPSCRRRSSPIVWLFVYGSLVASVGAGGRVAALVDHERWWGTAMDNRAALTGYKRYLDPATGVPPAIGVAFLDLRPRRDSRVDGVLIHADEDALRAFDRRERNYVRRDVTAKVIMSGAATPEGPIHTYVGSPAGRHRRRAALAAQRLVVHRGYLEAVTSAFTALGATARGRFHRSTAPPPCPVVPLRRVDT